MTAGFGIEKLGLLSLRFPWPSLILVALITPLLAYGANNLQFSSDLREIFQSESAAFDALDAVDAEFPGSEREVQVVVEGEDLFRPEALRELRELHDRLGQVEGVSDVVSIFSATRPPGQDGASQPLIPQDLNAIEDMGRLRQAILDHPLISGKMMAQDGTLSVLSAGLEGGVRSTEESSADVGRIRRATDEVLEDSGLTGRLTGIAVMRSEIVGALIRDQQRLRYGAMAVGLIICLVFFRKFRYVLLAGAPAALAVTWLLGLMWLTGQTVNVLTNVIPTLVLVIAFSDSVHMLFSIRDGLRVRKSLRKAVEQTVHEVGPACVLTSVTTALALSSLIFVEHQFIVDFGIIASVGVMLALLANLLVLPAMAMLVLPGLKAAARKEKDLVTRGIDALCRWAAAASTGVPRTLALAGLLLTIGAGYLHSLNEPMYRYVDNLPRDNPAYDAVTSIDQKLAGANSVKVLLEWPADYDFSSEQTLEAVRAVHEAVAEGQEFSATYSLATIVDWLGGGAQSQAIFTRLLSQGGSPLLEGVAAPDDTAALVTARFGNLTASELVPPLNSLEQRVSEIANDYSGLQVTVTGLVPISAEASYAMINQLNLSLIFAIGVIILLIALALRSPTSGVASVLPNLLPVAVGGLFLWLTGDGLQFTSVVAFTTGFGLAVDSTIHMLNRYRIERVRARNLNMAIARAITTVGPVVIISTIVVAAGLGVAVISELPMVQLYGEVSVVVLLTAMLGDLLVLPAVLWVIEHWRGRK